MAPMAPTAPTWGLWTCNINTISLEPLAWLLAWGPGATRKQAWCAPGARGTSLVNARRPTQAPGGYGLLLPSPTPPGLPTAAALVLRLCPSAAPVP